MQFLGFTPEQFFALSPERKPFGAPNWPCLNPKCEHYRVLCIEEYSLKYSPQRDRCPIGTFACPTCGYTYSRTGPDRTYSDRFKVDFTVKVDAYGPVWDHLLQELWANTSFSVKRVAREMQVGEGTILRQARRLGLPFPKPGSYSFKPTDELLSGPSSPSLNAQRDAFRMTYLTCVQANGHQGSGFVRALIPKEYNWLHKHDREWLKAHRPAKKRPVRSGPRKPNQIGRNWVVIDAELSGQVRVAAGELKNAPGGRTRITKKAIGKRLGQVALLEKSLDQLPKTKAVLAEVTETPDEYAVRRVQRVGQEFREAGFCPTRATIIDWAGIRYEMAERPIVKWAIEDLIVELIDFRT